MTDLCGLGVPSHDVQEARALREQSVSDSHHSGGHRRKTQKPPPKHFFLSAGNIENTKASQELNPGGNWTGCVAVSKAMSGSGGDGGGGVVRGY